MTLDVLLPSNATVFERAQADTSARILDIDTDIIRRERQPETCNAHFLPLLAWERSVHHWSGADVEGDKARIKTAFQDHQTYGSPQALESEISQDINYPVKIVEFAKAGLEWPDFAIEVPIKPDVSAPKASAIFASAVRRKNVRDWPAIVEFQTKINLNAGFAASPHIRAAIHIHPIDPTPRAEIVQYFGAAGNVRADIHLRAL
jgi:phage tail P2-like protein